MMAWQLTEVYVLKTKTEINYKFLFFLPLTCVKFISKYYMLYYDEIRYMKKINIPKKEC